MRTIRALIAAGLAIGFMSAGCAKKEGGAPSEPEPKGPVVEEFLEKAFTLLQGGQTNEALQVLDDATALFDQPELRARLFIEGQQILVNGGRQPEAEQRYLSAASTNAELARLSYGLIEDAYYRAQDFKGLEAWCRTLEGAGLPAELLPQLLRNRLNAVRLDGRFDEALEIARADVMALPADPAAWVLGSLIQELLGGGQLDEATRFVDLVEQGCSDKVLLCRLAANARVDLAMARGQWDALRETVKQAAAVLDDGGVAGVIERACRAALGAGRADVSDAVAELALTELKDMPAAAGRAARWWIITAKEAKDLDKALDRLERLIAMDLAQGNLSVLAGMLSADILSDGTRPHAERFIRLVDPLAQKAADENEKGRFLGMLLDASFKADDFGYTIKLIEGGVPGQDEEWHTVMLNKVRAHKALVDGNTDEAVRRFRDFMAHIAAKPDEGLVDPVSGDRVTKPMILALNARRIGDILAKAGKGDEAKAAYGEAVGYLKEALKDFEDGSREAATIRTQLDELAGQGTAAGQ